MIADVMACFPSFSYEYILKKMTFKQFLLWHSQFLRVKHNMEIKLKGSINVNELDLINQAFTWNEDKKRWE